jgi:hypothetical protein
MHSPFSDTPSVTATRRGHRVATPEVGVLPITNCIVPA